MVDAVQAAVQELQGLVVKLKSSERFFDQDALIDVVEQTAIGLSHLRSGAGQVQTNLEELETKVKNELVGGVAAKMSQNEQTVSGLAGSIALVEQKVNALEMIFTGISNAGMSIGGGKGGDRTRGILEYKAMQFLKPLSGDKGLFRQWHQKFVSAAYTVKEEFGELLKKLAMELDVGIKMDDLRKIIEDEFDSDFLDEWSLNLYTVLMDKAEGDAYDKIKGISGRDGIECYARVYRWFTEVSGLGLAEQARKLMHPTPPKREDELAGCVDAWCEGIRRLEGHGPRYVLAPLYKVTALRMMMVGRARDHFEIWQDESGDNDDEGFRRLLGRVRDYARRRTLDHSAEKAVSGGRGPLDMDCGGVHKGGAEHQGCGGDHQHQQGGDQQHQSAGGDQDVWNWIEAVIKGKGKGKSGFQGKCYACGEYGHSQHNCPHNKVVPKEEKPRPKAKGRVDSKGRAGYAGSMDTRRTTARNPQAKEKG